MSSERINHICRLRKNLSGTFLVTVCIALAGLCSGIILARTLPPFSRGEFAAVLLWPGMLALFGELGIGFAVSFFAGQNRAWVNGLWSLAWGVSVLWGGLLSLAGAVLFPGMVHLSEEANACLTWNLITVPISLLAGYFAFVLLGSKFVFEYNAIRLFGAGSYTLGVVAVAVMHQASVMHYTTAYILSMAMTCALATGLMIYRFNPSWSWRPDQIKPVLIYGGKTHLRSLSGQLNLRLDQLLMSSLVSLAELGWYVIAVSFSTILMPLFNALAVVTLPGVTHSPDPESGGRQVIHYFQLGLLIGIPAMGLVILTTPWLLPFFFGTAYVPSVLSAQILLVAVIFQGSNTVLGNGLCGLGHPGKTALSEGAGLIVSVPLLLWLLPSYGALGAAVASLCAYFLVAVMQVCFVQAASGLGWREFGLIPWKSMLNNFAVLRLWRVKGSPASHWDT